MLITQDMCDPDNPEEMALWAFFFLPQVGGAPMISHPDYYRKWSQHFYDLGFRHHPELQTKKLNPPMRGPYHAYNNAAVWVGVDEPEPEPIVLPDVSKLTDQEKYVMVEQLRAAGVIPESNPNTDVAKARSGKAQRE